MIGSTCSLAFCRGSDCWEGAKRCEQETETARGWGGGERAEERSPFFSVLSPDFPALCLPVVQATGYLSTLSAVFADVNHDEAFAVISRFTLLFIEDSLYSSISKMIQMLRSGYISGVR